ncbi:MAG: hypothetical protein HQL25_04595 [Candidatus Omnitrophica bacterium]|nr:hypothetical protein [Candidatus Omnitrophota bacterium]
MNTNIIARLFTFGVALFLAWGISSYADAAQQTTNGFTVETYTKGTPITFAGLDQISEPQKNQCFSDSHYGKVSLCKDGSQVMDMGTAGDVRAVYSRFPHENSDGTKYFMIRENTDYRLIIYNRSDNTVYKLVNEFPSLESSEMRWDNSGKYPNRLYFVNGCQFKQYDVTNGQSQLIHDFSKEYTNCGKIFMDVEGDGSADSRYWAWMVTFPYTNGQDPIQGFMVYDKESDLIVSRLMVSDYVRLGGKYDYYDANGNHAIPKPNMVEMAPSGKKVVLDFDRTWGGYGNVTNWIQYSANIWYIAEDTSGNSIGEVFEKRAGQLNIKYSGSSDYIDNPAQMLTAPGQYYYFRGSSSTAAKLYVRPYSNSNPNMITITYEWGNRPQDTGTVFDGAYAFDLSFINPIKVCVSSSHSGWSFDINGNELFVCQDDRTDWVTATNVLNGNKMNVIYHGDMDPNWRIGFHFGRVINRNLKGWIPVSTYNNPQDYIGLQNQVFMLELVDNVDHPRVWKIAHMRNNYDGNYIKEGYAPISKDGLSIWWGADWLGGDGTVDVYEAKLPNGWWTALARAGTTPSAVCGNGVIETGEVCDSNSLSCIATAGYAGTMQCGTTCTNFLSCQTTEYCGDGIKNGKEQCDGSAGVGANQKCDSSCKLVQLSVCGDGIVSGSEQCDGTIGVGANQICTTSNCQIDNAPTITSAGAVSGQYVYWSATDVENDPIKYVYSIDNGQSVETANTKLLFTQYTVKGFHMLVVKAVDSKGAASPTKSIFFIR